MVKSDIIIVKNFHGVFCLNLVNEIFENKYKIIDILGKGGMSTVYWPRTLSFRSFGQ